MPAPTMAPMPRKTAPRSVISCVGTESGSDGAFAAGVVAIAFSSGMVLRIHPLDGTAASAVGGDPWGCMRWTGRGVAMPSREESGRGAAAGQQDRMMRTRHRWRWKDVRRWLTDHTGRWKPISADGIELFNPTDTDQAVSPSRRRDPQRLGTSCVNK